MENVCVKNKEANDRRRDVMVVKRLATGGNCLHEEAVCPSPKSQRYETFGGGRGGVESYLFSGAEDWRNYNQKRRRAPDLTDLILLGRFSPSDWFDHLTLSCLLK